MWAEIHYFFEEGKKKRHFVDKCAITFLLIQEMYCLNSVVYVCLKISTNRESLI